jgi:hypothetical protein
MLVHCWSAVRGSQIRTLLSPALVATHQQLREMKTERIHAYGYGIYLLSGAKLYTGQMRRKGDRVYKDNVKSPLDFRVVINTPAGLLCSCLILSAVVASMGMDGLGNVVETEG